MAAAITGSVNSNIRAVRTPDSGIYSGVPDELNAVFNAMFSASGTTADKVDRRYVKRITFASATQQTIDLSAAVGDDGITNAFVEVVAIAIRHRGTTAASYLSIDNAGATNPFTGFLNSAGTLKIFPSTLDSDAVSLKNNGFVILCAPNDAAAVVSTGVNIRLLPSSHAFDADVIILGRSA